MGVPLFQEQLRQMAMAVGGITGDLADEIYLKIEAFANFGFAESHSIGKPAAPPQGAVDLLAIRSGRSG